MCGISGIYNIIGREIEKDILLKMTKIISHRGPDDEGYTIFDTLNDRHSDCYHHDTMEELKKELTPLSGSINGNLGFGFRRLSILDLTRAGHQPMSNSEASVWIVFNGEIYNYIELRNELMSDGYKFNSETDTEVIIAAYQKWGTQCLNRLNGMFAFAIWDSRSKTLLIARDRFGVKPLYYAFDGNTLVFGSEVKQLLAYGISRELNETTIIKTFSIGGFTENSGTTYFKNIKYLPNAHFLIIKNGNLSVLRYYDIDFETMGNSSLSYEQACENYRELFTDSIKIRMRSDVNVGSTLSGGLDSSAIVCTASRFDTKSFNTYTYYSNEHNRFDERKWANLASGKVGGKAHFVSKTAVDFVHDFEKITWHHDYPLMGSSHVAQYYVMQLAKLNGTKVLLDGQGSDEISAGYVHAFYRYYSDLLINGDFSKFFKEFSQFSTRLQKGSVISKSMKTLLTLALNERSLYKVEYNLSMNPLTISKKEADINEFINIPRASKLNNFLYNQTMSSSVQTLMQTEDRNAMAHSVENREPFLDYRLVELLFSLPASYKIKGSFGKLVHRDALKGVVPVEILERKDKLGFLAPGEEYWMRNELKGFYAEMLQSASFKQRGIFNQKMISQLYQKYLQGDNSNCRMLWMVMSLEIWFRTFVDK